MENDYIQLIQTPLQEADCNQIINTIESVFVKYNIKYGKEITLEQEDVQYSRFMREDWALFITNFDELKEISRYILDITAEGLRTYTKTYPSLISTYETLTNTVLKYQKTPKNGGYHVFHTEHSGKPWFNTRVLAWTLYLNDLEQEDRGETEFLHFNRRITPKAGLLAIWPAYWPWVHRGNPPEKTKHIITGWFNDQILECKALNLSQLMKS